MRKPSLTLLLSVLGLILLTPAFAAAKPVVFVSILPQKYFINKIAGDLVKSQVMVLPGASPATYEPSPRQMAQLSAAKAYFAIGVPFEKNWLEKLQAANKQMLIVHTDQNIHKRPMQKHVEHATHAHHHAEIMDPHIWLSPELVKTQAKNICQGLIKIDTANKDKYQNNLQKFLHEIEQLNTSISKVTDKIPAARRKFMVFHPSWGYFAHDYGLQQIPIESEGKEPSPKALQQIIKKGRKLNIAAIFVQPQFSRRSAQLIASEMQAKVIALNPLAPDWKKNLLQAAQAFQQALK